MTRNTRVAAGHDVTRKIAADVRSLTALVPP